MRVLAGIFVFGCFVTAMVALGLLFAMAALGYEDPTADDERSAGEDE